MKRAVLLAWGLLVPPVNATQGPAPPPPPVRTPIPASGGARLEEATQRAGARLAGHVFFGEREGPRAGGFTLTLLGEGLTGARAIQGSSVGLPVEGGTGRFEWSVVSPGYDPARGLVTLREGETATIGYLRLVPGSASVEGLVSGPDGRPAAGAEILVSGPIAPGESARTKADETGRFRFEGLAAGKGFLRLMADDLPAMAAVPIEVSSGGRHWIELSAPVGSLLLRVHGKWERPFRLRLDDEDRGLAISWRVEPPEWVEDGLDLSFSMGIG